MTTENITWNELDDRPCWSSSCGPRRLSLHDHQFMLFSVRRHMISMATWLVISEFNGDAIIVSTVIVSFQFEESSARGSHQNGRSNRNRMIELPCWQTACVEDERCLRGTSAVWRHSRRLYRQRGQYDRTEQLHRTALDLYRQIVGERLS
jgi:hypothetical protein